VIYHTRAHAGAALAAAEALGRPVVLLTPPGGHAYLGAAYLKRAAESAAARHPGAAYDLVLDCGRDAAAALDAMRRGWRRVLFTGPAGARAKLAEAGGGCGVEVLTRPPPALDLLGRADPPGACRAWLSEPD